MGKGQNRLMTDGGQRRTVGLHCGQVLTGTPREVNAKVKRHVRICSNEECRKIDLSFCGEFNTATSIMSGWDGVNSKLEKTARSADACDPIKRVENSINEVLTEAFTKMDEGDIHNFLAAIDNDMKLLEKMSDDTKPSGEDDAKPSGEDDTEPSCGEDKPKKKMKKKKKK